MKYYQVTFQSKQIKEKQNFEMGLIFPIPVVIAVMTTGCVSFVQFENGKNFRIMDETKKQKLQVQNFFMSPLSSPYWNHGHYVGMIIYYANDKFANDIFPSSNSKVATIVIKDVKELDNIISEEGGIYGRLCKWYCDYEPSQILAKFKAIVTGFEVCSDVQQIQVRQNCQIFNSNSSIFHNSSKYMHSVERRVIQAYLLIYRDIKQKLISSKQIEVYLNGKKS